MAWLSALIKGILEWLSSEVKKDTKAGDADTVPDDLKNRWRTRIKEQLKKEKPKSKKNVKKHLSDAQKQALEKDGEKPSDD
jgi:hypothetical protein